jgi:hypothetical protein
VIRRTRVALLPRLGVAAIRAKILATVRTVAEVLARAAIRRAAGKFLVAAEFSFGTIAIAWTSGKGPVGARTIAILAESFTTRRVRSLLTAFATRRIGPLVTEFLVGETRLRPRIAAITTRGIGPFFTSFSRRIWTLVAATIVAGAKLLARAAIGPVATARRAVVFVETGRTRSVTIIATRSVTLVAARSVTIIAARSVAVVAARRRTLALPGIGLARSRIRFLAVGFGAVRLAGIGTLLAIRPRRVWPLVAIALAGKAALGEFLLWPPGDTGAALAAGGAITPAAVGVVVFIVVAGHEWSHCRVVKW